MEQFVKILVKNLSHQATQEDVRELFEEYGYVRSVDLRIDRETGRPRGSAVVEMATEYEAEAAIKALDGKELLGRAMKLTAIRPDSRRW